jgi:CRP/FNR family transcriptional regulator
MTINLAAEFRHAAIINSLRQCALFADIPAADLTAIASITFPKSLRRGEYLFLGGAPVDGFFVVQKGAIKLHRLNLQGHEQVFHVFRPTESFGEEMILSDAGYLADASAAENSQFLHVQKNGFLALLKTQPGLAFHVLRSAGRRVASLMELLDDLTLKDASARLANWLIQHCPHPDSEEPQRIEIQSTKQLLALELGLASETLSRTLNKFRTQHFIDVQGRSLTLLCPARLLEFARRKTGLPVENETSWSASSGTVSTNCSVGHDRVPVEW